MKYAPFLISMFVLSLIFSSFSAKAQKFNKSIFANLDTSIVLQRSPSISAWRPTSPRKAITTATARRISPSSVRRTAPGICFRRPPDLPATGDFDGDNKSDFAVYRPSNGVWYLLQSRSGFIATAFGISTDKPISNAYLPQ